MKFAIVGAGVMGTILGAFLQKAGADVWLINRNEEIVQTINKKGLKVILQDGEKIFRLKAVQTPKEIKEKMDVVLFLVKGNDTEQAAKEAKILVDTHTYIMTLQNGIGNVNILEEFYPREKILYGILEFAGKMLEPGVVKAFISTNSKICFGPVTKQLSDPIQTIAAFFDKTTINCTLYEDVEKEVWIKLRNNSTNVVFGLLRLTMGQALSQKGTDEIMQCVRNEVIEIAKAKGLIFSDEELSVNKGKTPVNPELYQHLPSTALDMKNKKQTEVEFINGAIYREGQKFGIPTPYNEMLYRMVKIMELSYKMQY